VLCVLQFFAGVATAWSCGRLADRWSGRMAGRFALIAALFVPTLMYFIAEVLTEAVALLLGILFVLHLDKALRTPGRTTLVYLGAISVISAFEWFNAVALAPIACAAVFAWLPRETVPAHTNAPPDNWSSLFLRQPERWRRGLVVAVSCLIVTAPWLMRTVIVFQGKRSTRRTAATPRPKKSSCRWVGPSPAKARYCAALSDGATGGLKPTHRPGLSSATSRRAAKRVGTTHSTPGESLGVAYFQLRPGG
jgi:hypothetical protein